MSEIIAEKIKKIMHKFQIEFKNNQKEENVKNHVIIPVLKEILGYSECLFDYEFGIGHKNKCADIAVKIDKSGFFYIEAKRADAKLTVSDVIQLIEYMHLNSIQWGLLSNGHEYVLVNDKIELDNVGKDALLGKVVFWINTKTKRHLQYFHYLKKESIFDTGVTEYFKDIAQFKVYKNQRGKERSWIQYEGTLFTFFNYYAMVEKRYRTLNEIRFDEFVTYVKDCQKQKENTGKSINSEETFKNKYSHIREMFNEYKKRGKFQFHYFEKERQMLIDSMNCNYIKKDENFFNYENIKKAITYFEKADNKRNTLIFLLSIYLGMERSIIRELNWDMFDGKRKEIRFLDRTIKLPNKITRLLLALEDENKSNKIKSSYVFHLYYEGKYKQISEGAINDVFNKLINVDKEDAKWNFFSPQYVRKNLVLCMFDYGISIENIIYHTGMEMTNVSKIISFSKICEIVSKRNKNLGVHPFESLLT